MAHDAELARPALRALAGRPATPSVKGATWLTDIRGSNFFSLAAESAFAQMDVRDALVRFSTPVDALATTPTQWSLSRDRPLGVAAEPLACTLEYFLTERYCLYNMDNRSRAYRLEIHHPPWKLRHAEAEFERQDMVAWAPITLEPV